MEHRGGAVLATSGLVVANENLGGDYFAYLVSALGGSKNPCSRFWPIPTAAALTFVTPRDVLLISSRKLPLPKHRCVS